MPYTTLKECGRSHAFGARPAVTAIKCRFTNPAERDSRTDTTFKIILISMAQEAISGDDPKFVSSPFFYFNLKIGMDLLFCGINTYRRET
jgi:hypothetical protein